MLSDTDFTSPLNPATILLDSQIGGSVTVGGASNTLTFQSYVDPQDREAMLSGFTAGAQTPNITGETSKGQSQKSYSDDRSTWITSGLTSAYSITEYFKLTLDNGSQIGFQSSTDLADPTPEPSSLVLAGAGALGLIGYTLRRRMAPGVRQSVPEGPGAGLVGRLKPTECRTWTSVGITDLAIAAPFRDRDGKG
jgi:hypothetical protein